MPVIRNIFFTILGDKTVVNSGNFDTKPCTQDRFQPFSFSTSQGNDCIFKKSICSDDGQIVYGIGSRRNDRECRCDYTKSFKFLSTSRKHRCSCDPTEEDCSCFMKSCGPGEVLSPGRNIILKFSRTEISKNWHWIPELNIWLKKRWRFLYLLKSVKYVPSKSSRDDNYSESRHILTVLQHLYFLSSNLNIFLNTIQYIPISFKKNYIGICRWPVESGKCIVLIFALFLHFLIGVRKIFLFTSD